MASPWRRGLQRLKRRDASGGFTLLEAVVALAILGVVLVAALEAAGQALRTQAVAQRHVEAVGLAESKMNALVASPLDSLGWYSTTRSGRNALASNSYTWRVITRQDPEAPQLWEAAVLIEWDGGEFDLETTFYRRESVTIQRRAQ